MDDGWQIRVRGLVQGVGFRPTVWQLATAQHLNGSVCNTAAGVTIELHCDILARDRFLKTLQETLPRLARIDEIECEPLVFALPPDGFAIKASEEGVVSTAIVADAMICETCAGEIRDPSNRRYGYAFANCTHCGPRLSIVRKIPYDRANTSMAAFPMCESCQAEYANPVDRRHHAEPIACAECGPKVWLESAATDDCAQNTPIETAAEMLLQGSIVAIKGIGGFHLAGLASSESAVARMRTRKRRPRKPLALMAASLQQISQIADFDGAEANLLTSQRGPIVLLKRRTDADLAESLAPGHDRIGVMLPTSPLHTLLLDHVGAPLVMTSANESGVPQCISNERARTLLGPVADAILFHDRDIVSRVDDSVLRLDEAGPCMLRRARGYAPEPFILPVGLRSGPSVFAAGADLKSAFAFADQGEVVVSQHLGDLDDMETRQAYAESAELYASIFERKPKMVAFDSHPAYASAAMGAQMALAWDAEILRVQHHHAHLASCLAENGWSQGKALGIILDGTGYGDDQTIWGGEFLLGDYAGYRRIGHFLPVPMIGADKASTEPWRNAFAHLATAFGPVFMQQHWSRISGARGLSGQHSVQTLTGIMAARKLSPLSSSAGRLFDAAAWLIGLMPEHIDYEGQAGMELEALAVPHMGTARHYGNLPQSPVLSWHSLWEGMMDDLAAEMPAGLLAARFHQTVIAAACNCAVKLCREHRIQTVALSGGVFQNSLLLEGIRQRLTERGLKVLYHSNFPANDGGIALGQAAIAIAAGRKP